DFSRWSTGSGAWTDAGHWSNGVPSPFLRTEVHGVSHITIPSGTFIAGDLEVGLNPEDDTSVTLDGGELVLMQDSLRIGEETGGRAEFTMLGGAMHCPVDVCVGAANGVPGRGTHASLRIRGGSFLARDLLTGIGWGAQCCLSIEGSHASAIHLLDYCYFQAYADVNGKAGSSVIRFTLDEHGVTPITVQSHFRGLEIRKDAKSRCVLQIQLSAVPPREDVTLVSTHVPIKGRFDGLPEGSEIIAEFAGQVYHWQLTYHGGPQGHDLVLKNRSTYPADAPVTHVLPIPKPPKALW